MKKVSIIIPTYNRKDFIKTAVESSLKQTYPKVEIIVIDDNSDYEIYDVLKEFEEKILIIKNKHNIGCAATQNKAIRKSSGDYITILDDDDIFHPKKIERQMKIFNRKKNVGLVYCPIAKRINNRLIYKPLTERNNVWIRLTHKNTIGITPLIKKECFSVCGFFDTSLEYHEDRDLWYRIGKEFEFGFDENPSYIVYNHSISRLSSQIEKICSGKKALYEKHKHDFEDEDKYYADLHFELAYEYLKFSGYRNFLKHFRKSISKNLRCIKDGLKIPLDRFGFGERCTMIDEDLC